MSLSDAIKDFEKKFMDKVPPSCSPSHAWPMSLACTPLHAFARLARLCTPCTPLHALHAFHTSSLAVLACLWPPLEPLVSPMLEGMPPQPCTRRCRRLSI